jgi:hypothetical protein
MATSIFPTPEEAHNSPRTNIDCHVCDQHFYSVELQLEGKLTYAKSVDDTEAQAMLTSRTEYTGQALDYVKDRFRTHDDLITSRWKNMSRDKRAILLSQSSESLFGPWPEPEYEDALLGRLLDDHDISRTLQFRMAPHLKVGPCCNLAGWLEINTFAEDPMRLLSLFRSRTDHAPQYWIPFDTIQSSRCFGEKRGDFSYNAGAVIKHGDRYGQLTKFDLEQVYSWALMGFSRAIVTMDTQALIASMLHAAVDLLITGEEMKSSGNLKWLAMMSPGLRSAQEDALWSSYQLDAAVLLQKARNQLNFISDEVELLQTSPEYMHQLIEDMEKNVVVTKAHTRGSRDHVGNFTMNFWLQQIVLWRRIVVECEHLEATLAGCWDIIKPGSRLPRDVDLAIQAFGKVVRDRMVFQAECLYAGIRTMDVMRDLNPENLPASDLLDDDQILRALDPTKKADRIFWQVHIVVRTIKVLTPYGAESAILGLNTELVGVKSNKIVAFSLSALALWNGLYMCSRWHQLSGHDTNDPKWSSTIYKDTLSREELFDRMTSAEREAATQLSTRHTRACSRYLREFCEAPRPQDRRDLTWLRQMTEARKCLGRYWRCCRYDLSTSLRRGGHSEASTKRLMAYMSFDESNAYLSRLKIESQQIEGVDLSTEAAKQRSHADTHFVRQLWDTAGASESGPIRRKVTKKFKEAHERSSVQTGLESLTITDCTINTEPDTSCAVTIPVKQDTLSVVRKMFPAPGTRVDKGTVRWINLVQTLGDCGMAAMQGAGSVVNFENKDGNISIHSPHPETEVDAIKLRSYGQRLGKWFGWTDKTFVPRGKNDEKLPAENELT